jgi:MazG family protein
MGMGNGASSIQQLTGMPENAGHQLERLLDIMRRLRGPDGCPWDRAQDLASLRPYLVEEAYEVLDAMDRGDMAELRAELGDLVFQVVFQSQIATEAGAFDMAGVLAGIADKLVRRHPHVFADLKLQDAEAVHRNWAELKRAERLAADGTASALDGVPRQAPALLRAERLGEKAAREGFDWPDISGVRAKIDEELGELDEALRTQDRTRISAELGDLLFTLTNLARWMETPAEDALRAAIHRFETRFRYLESRLAEIGQRARDVGSARLEELWSEAKRATVEADPVHPTASAQEAVRKL